MAVSIIRLKQTSEWINIRVKWGTSALMLLGYASLTSIVYLNDDLIFAKIIIIILMTVVFATYLKSAKKISNSI